MAAERVKQRMIESVANIVGDFKSALDEARRRTEFSLLVEQIGTVVSVGEGVAHVEGLENVFADELVELPDQLFGIATSIREGQTGLILLGQSTALQIGAPAKRTRRVVDVPVGEDFLGRIIDPLGRPLDEGGDIRQARRAPIEAPAPAIMDRAPVSTPLQTGVKSIDATIPIGRGQRELILGDRQTGKTTIAVEAILNQRETDVISIYCAIGQRASATARVIETLRRHDALESSIVLVASGNDAPALQYVAPYAATT